VIYTSGSTGAPKGVVVDHHALTNKVRTLNDFLGVTPETRYAAITSISFDPLLEQLLCPLCAGAPAVLVEDDIRGDAQRFATYANRHRISLLDSSPGLLEALLSSKEKIRLDTLLLGGDVLPARLANKLLAAGMARRVFNLYGPTEACIDASAYELPALRLSDPVAIGTPLPSYRLYVLDAALEPVAVGVTGELCIAGVGLARGYLGRPGLTAERFVANPHEEHSPGCRMYRSGDLVRWRRGGTLEFLGRADQQVKIRGFRIELGEIEAALQRHERVEKAIVTVIEEGALQQIIGYVVARSEDVKTLADEELGTLLQDGLRQQLPEHMVPSAILVLPSWPLLPNGKIDRQALPTRTRRGESYRPPRTPEEQILCQLFSEVLFPKAAPQRVGIDDSFFALGGHSLLATTLVSRISGALGLELRLRTLFEAPTVSALAMHLHLGTSEEGAFSPVLPLRPRGSLPPLFCIYPGGGLSWIYAGLVPEIHPERPIYGVQERRIGTSDPFPNSVEEAAEEAIQLVREIQPTGPYHLLGWSFGGLVALTVACQLQQEEEEVALLTLLDSYPPQRAGRSLLPKETEEELIEQLVEQYNLGEGAGEVQDIPSFVQAARRAGQIPEGFGLFEMQRMLEHFAHCGHLIPRFSPGRFEGDLILVVATEGRVDRACSAEDWTPHITGHLHVHEFDCHHMEIAQHAHMASIGRLLRKYLEGLPGSPAGQ
jgi:nonribosomal peptide synthetase DhbF